MAHTVTLTWQDDGSATGGFNVYRGAAVGSETKIASVAAGVLTYVDESPLATDSYFVRAVANGVESANSNEVTVSLPASAPTNLVAVVN